MSMNRLSTKRLMFQLALAGFSVAIITAGCSSPSENKPAAAGKTSQATADSTAPTQQKPAVVEQKVPATATNGHQNEPSHDEHADHDHSAHAHDDGHDHSAHSDVTQAAQGGNKNSTGLTESLSDTPMQGEDQREATSDMIYALIRIRMETMLEKRRQLLTTGKDPSDVEVRELEGSIMRARGFLTESGEMVEEVNPPIVQSSPRAEASSNQ